MYVCQDEIIEKQIHIFPSTPSSAILNGIWSWIQNHPIHLILDICIFCYRLSIKLKLDWVYMWILYLKSGLWTWILKQKDKDKNVVVYLDLKDLGLCCSQFVLFCFIILAMVYITHQNQNTRGCLLLLVGDVWKYAFNVSCTVFFVFTVTFTANMWEISFLLFVQWKWFLKIPF